MSRSGGRTSIQSDFYHCRCSWLASRCLSVASATTCHRRRQPRCPRGHARHHHRWQHSNNPLSMCQPNMTDWVMVLCPTRHKIGHQGDVSPSQSLRLVWKKNKHNKSMHSPINRNVLQHKKARFSCLLWHPAWKWSDIRPSGCEWVVW